MSSPATTQAGPQSRNLHDGGDCPCSRGCCFKGWYRTVASGDSKSRFPDPTSVPKNPCLEGRPCACIFNRDLNVTSSLRAPSAWCTLEAPQLALSKCSPMLCALLHWGFHLGPFWEGLHMVIIVFPALIQIGENRPSGGPQPLVRVQVWARAAQAAFQPPPMSRSPGQ